MNTARFVLLTTLMVAASSHCLAADFVLSPESSITLQGTMQTDLDGTLIGDWDAASNPDGTSTLPGVWGGSGNNPIPLEMTLTIGFDGTRVPEGNLDVMIDDELGTATISALAWNLLGEETIPATMSVTVLYETFRSVNPDSLFPGGVPVEIPMGEARVTSCLLTQQAPGVGTAVPVDGQPGAHELAVAVPVMMDLLVATDALGDLPMQMPLVLLVNGVHQAGDATDFLTITATADAEESTDLPGEPLPTIPMELPTVVPPGELAGVLLDLTPRTASVALNLSSDIFATHQQGPLGDLNGDGVVGTDDLLAVLAAWGACDACPEDLDGDGYVGVNEILLIIDHWS